MCGLAAFGRVDEYLAIGDVNIAIAVDGNAFAASLRERLQVSERAIGAYFGAVGNVFGLA